MKKIAIITTTRAEYGLLSPVIKELRKFEDKATGFIVDLIVTGTHLSKQFGMTLNEIEDRIDLKIPIEVNSGSAIDISSNQADTLIKFTELFVKERYNGIIILGDRYETLAIAIAAGNTRTPIFHMCGGDTTEGAIDEWIRHSITKMSYLHFVTNIISKHRVIQLGESPERVFNYGSTSIDNILNVPKMSKCEALASLGLSDCRFALCTYHPVTMESTEPDGQIRSLIDAIKTCKDIEFIVTKANSDQGGACINEILDNEQKHVKNLHVFSSLGVVRYLSLMMHSEFVIGNSSSGIIEAPALKVPTINIGDRQRGRLQSESIINCNNTTYDILAAIQKVMSKEHKDLCRAVRSPYGDGQAAYKIAATVYKTIKDGRIDIKKKFYDLNEDCK